VQVSTPNHIRKLEQRRQALIEKLLECELMLRGKFGVAYRRCGTPTCWCAKGEGHPNTRITWTENATSRTKSIPAEDIEWAKQHTETYRRFRKNRQALRELERKLNAALDAMEEKRVQKTRKQRKYL
jgi:hypothetical protein